jgi:hypothetical protein
VLTADQLPTAAVMGTIAGGGRVSADCRWTAHSGHSGIRERYQCRGCIDFKDSYIDIAENKEFSPADHGSEARPGRRPDQAGDAWKARIRNCAVTRCDTVSERKGRSYRYEEQEKNVNAMRAALVVGAIANARLKILIVTALPVQKLWSTFVPWIGVAGPLSGRSTWREFAAFF